MEQSKEVRPNNSKMVSVGKNGRKVYPKGTVFTKLKFKQSEQTGRIVGFVTQNSAMQWIKGVREEAPVGKRVCVVDAELAPSIIENRLYNVALIPMRQKNGFIVIDAQLYKFKAKIEICYVPKACYSVTVKWGNARLTFNPMDANGRESGSIQEIKEKLEKRFDIQNLSMIVEDFVEAAECVLKKYKQDGFYVKKGA